MFLTTAASGGYTSTLSRTLWGVPLFHDEEAISPPLWGRNRRTEDTKLTRAQFLHEATAYLTGPARHQFLSLLGVLDEEPLSNSASKLLKLLGRRNHPGLSQVGPLIRNVYDLDLMPSGVEWSPSEREFLARYVGTATMLAEARRGVTRAVWPRLWRGYPRLGNHRTDCACPQCQEWRRDHEK